MKLIFPILNEQCSFKQSSDQIKVSFEKLDINSSKIQSFTIAFQFMLDSNPKLIKDDVNIMQTGNSLMSRNITVGINREELLFVSFLTI